MSAAPSPGPAPAPPRGDGVPPGLKPLEKGDPARVGPYRIVGRIGAGGMGAVYGGLDTNGTCVAVKTVHAKFARRARYREAFAREVQMLARARGVSTARLHAADIGAKVPWLAFDYIAGRDLRAHVRAFGPLEGEMLQAFAVGTAEGLAALHAAGIAHRDIKPGNVILAPDGPKIVDFGIATTIGAQRAADHGASYGTPGWAAPERYAGVSAAPAADVFAWGGLVALAATGRDPFGEGTPDTLRLRVTTGAHDLTGVPHDLRPLVEAALSVDPDERPRAVRLMRALLPPPGEVGVSGEDGHVPAAETLRAMLRNYWNGVDDAGHEPARWAAAVGLLSAAGIAGGVLGTSGGAGAGAGAGAGTAGGAAAGSGATASASGSALGALAGSKAAVAGLGLLVTAGAATGGYLVYDQVRIDPREAVSAASSTLEEGEGFTAVVERSYSDTRAEEVAAETGQSAEAVVEESRTTSEYLYASAEDAFLIRGADMGEGTTAAAGVNGGLYVYGAAMERGVARESVHRPVPEGVTADTVGPSLISGPLRAMVEADGLEAEGDASSDPEHNVYSGPLTATLLVDGALVEEEAAGRVELDPDGAPVWWEYSTDTWRVRVDFTQVDSPAEVSDPQIDDEGEALTVLHAPVCGQVPYDGREWDVRADAWEMDCERAMEVTALSRSETVQGEAGQVRLLGGYSGSGTTTVLVDDDIACESYREYLGMPEGEPDPWHLSTCVPAIPLGENEFGHQDVEFEPWALIRYFEAD